MQKLWDEHVHGSQLSSNGGIMSIQGGQALKGGRNGKHPNACKAGGGGGNNYLNP
jgi:hypothetical protein